jgi:CheY-like chemotaxis protein
VPEIFSAKSCRSKNNAKLQMLLVGKNVEVVTKYLKSLDEFFNVAVAFNGVEALSKLNSKAWNYFDVIVCSIDLPMMDGFEFC